MSPRSVVLMCATVLAALVIVARMFEIQVGQGEVWAGEAARLVRTGTLLPYRRGSITDARGRVLARDEATYRLELSYREFRRNHPLGLVAHARSALERRAVPLQEALRELDRWTLELAQLSPSDLDVFARGGPLTVGSFEVGLERDPERSLRARRASHLRFYIARLCGFGKLDLPRLRERMNTGGRVPSFVELLAEWRDMSVDEARNGVLERVARSRRHLTLLAERLAPASADAGRELASGSALMRLVDDLQQVRNTVEELVASSLFREAAGFSPGRLESDTLYGTMDLSWIARALFWDEARLIAWCEETRRRWIDWRDDYAVPHLLVEFIARGDVERGVDRFLGLLGTIYAESAALDLALDGRDPRGARPAVFGRLRNAFGLSETTDYRLPVAELLAGATPGAEWRVFEPLIGDIDVRDEQGEIDAKKAWRVGRLEKALKQPRRLSRYDLELVAEQLVPAWERDFQDALAATLRAAIASSSRADAASRESAARVSPNGRLAVADEARELALETFRDVLRDYGDRSLTLESRPAYEVVYLLTRFPDEYDGFRAVDARVRVRPALAFGPSSAIPATSDLAESVIGSVSAVGIDEIQRQRQEEQRLQELRGRTRTDEEEDELRHLFGEVLLRSESRGVSGIEGEWDDALRGRHGYRESRGLEDVYGRGRTSAELSQRVDGEDVQLSIDAELQADVERMLENPEYDRNDPKVDVGWFREPVGAVVLLSATGEVVVAASVPNATTDAGPDGRQRASAGRPDRSVHIDRTLRKPAFQPPGSVFKPFVVAWALDRLGLDPETEVDCRWNNGPPAYENVRCWNTSGHGPVNLSKAIKGSCNCYFAWLGEQFPGAAEMRAMATAFGFGRPTGVRRGGQGAGLFEEYVPDLLTRRMSRREACLAGNGLAVVEATPMQVARATLALATGELTLLANTLAVGGRPLERPDPTPVPVSAESLELVRRAMFRVSNEEGGTAYTALNEAEVGTKLVVKTGSADLESRRVSASEVGALKHTWVAGWLPPEDPKAVFVVFLDKTRATSSHTAVYVARQLLRLPSVRAWLESEGVPFR